MLKLSNGRYFFDGKADLITESMLTPGSMIVIDGRGFVVSRIYERNVDNIVVEVHSEDCDEDDWYDGAFIIFDIIASKYSPFPNRLRFNMLDIYCYWHPTTGYC